MPVRQEVLNVLLAQLLQERGLVSAPEQIQRSQGRGRRMPDVLVDFQGLRLAIEGEFATRARGTAASAETRAGEAALRKGLHMSGSRWCIQVNSAPWLSVS